MAIHSHWFTLPVPCLPRTMKLEGPHKQSIKGAKRKGKCTNRPSGKAMISHIFQRGTSTLGLVCSGSQLAFNLRAVL